MLHSSVFRFEKLAVVALLLSVCTLGTGFVVEAKLSPTPTEAPQAHAGNLTPGKAAEITYTISQTSLAEMPTKDLPKDAKLVREINERIRSKCAVVYSGYGTTEGAVIEYISDLSPKDRDTYNNHLNELFVQASLKKAKAEHRLEEPTPPKQTGKQVK